MLSMIKLILYYVIERTNNQYIIDLISMYYNNRKNILHIDHYFFVSFSTASTYETDRKKNMKIHRDCCQENEHTAYAINV